MPSLFPTHRPIHWLSVWQLAYNQTWLGVPPSRTRQNGGCGYIKDLHACIILQRWKCERSFQQRTLAVREVARKNPYSGHLPSCGNPMDVRGVRLDRLHTGGIRYSCARWSRGHPRVWALSVRCGAHGKHVDQNQTCELPATPFCVDSACLGL